MSTKTSDSSDITTVDMSKAQDDNVELSEVPKLEATENRSKGQSEKESDMVGRVRYRELLLRFADRTTVLYMVAGSLTAGLAGCTRPLMTIVFAG